MTAPAPKTCALPACGAEFGFRTGGSHRESAKQFEARRFCSRSCASASRRTRAHPPAAAPTARIEGGVWRPRAYGWPAQPAMPQRAAS